MTKSSCARCSSALRVNTVLDCICILVRSASVSAMRLALLPSGTCNVESGPDRTWSTAAGVTGEVTGVNLENKDQATGGGVGVPAGSNNQIKH